MAMDPCRPKRAYQVIHESGAGSCSGTLVENVINYAADLDQRTLFVRGKGGHERVVPYPAGVAAALADYLALRRTLLRGPDRGVLFLSEEGLPLSKAAFWQWLRAHARRVLGQERHVFPHLLRHSYAVALLLGKADIRYVQELLGHADLDTTRIYLRLLPEHLRADYEAAMPELLAMK